MWGTVLLMAVVVGLEPEYVAGIKYILSRSSPLYRLIAFYVSGIITSLLAGILIVFAFGHVDSGNSLTLSPTIKVIAGIAFLGVALLFGAGIVTKIHDQFIAKRPKKSDKPPGIERIPGFNKLPSRIKMALQYDAPLIAWSAGIYVGIPGAYYLAAIAAILTAKISALTELAALLVFNLIAFMVVEGVIIAMIIKPDTARYRLGQLHKWIVANNRTIIVSLLSIAGLYLLFMGIAHH